MKCLDCKFAGPKFNYEDRECRRRSPEVRTVEFHRDLRGHIPVWPIMKPDDWCGEYATASKDSS